VQELTDSGKFELPHYVILRKTMEEGQEFVLHRHTIPSFIPLVELCEEFLGRGVAGLEELCLSVHRHLILLSNRTAIVSRLKNVEGIETVRADDAVRLVEIVTSQWIAKIVLLDKGERCVVINHNDERMQDIEKQILENADTDLVERIIRVM
jgi:Cenp-O kinetochore centromere component